MPKYHQKGKYLTAEMRFKYNPRTDSIDVTPNDPELAREGFIYTLPLTTAPGTKMLRLLAKHNPRLMDAVIDVRQFDEVAEDTRREPSAPSPYLIPLGIDRDGEEVYWDVTEDQNAVIVGRPGSGKTVMIESITEHLGKFEQEWEVIVFNSQDTYHQDYQDTANTTFLTLDRPNESRFAYLERLLHTLDQVAELVKARQSIQFSPDNQCRVMLLVDNLEYFFHLGDEDKDTQEKIKRTISDLLNLIAQEGRSVGVHIAASAFTLSGVEPTLLQESSLILAFGGGHNHQDEHFFGKNLSLMRTRLSAGYSFLLSNDMLKEEKSPVLIKARTPTTSSA